jgi:hypothetical protein
VNVEMTRRNEECERGAAISRQPGLMLNSHNPQRPSPSHSVPSVPLVPFVPSRPFDETGRTSSSIKADHTQSHPIKPNQGENRPPTRFDRAGWWPKPTIFAHPGKAAQHRMNTPPISTNSHQIAPNRT